MPTTVDVAMSVLLATLGTKPQVVTTAVDLLLAEGHALSEVVVFYTGGEQGLLRPVLERLHHEFASHAVYQSMTFHTEPIVGQSGAVLDVQTQADAEAVFRTMYRVVRQAKRDEKKVHLSIVGGRKVFAVYGMVTAQLLFDDDDRLWYVLAGGEFFEKGRMHPNHDDEAQLVPVPVLRWRTISPVLTDLSQIDDPFEAIELQRSLRLQETLDEARAFVLGVLSGAELRVVKLLAREGLTDDQLAERLSLSHKTVGHHLASAYDKARLHWQLEEVGRHHLIALLQLHFLLNSHE